jgi:hypothetical protein
MRTKLALVGVLAAIAALVTGLTIAPAASAGSTVRPNLTTVPVEGTTSSGGTFDGTVDVDRLSLQNGHLIANGTLTGTVENAAGETVGSVEDRQVSLPVSSGEGATCQIADLSIGAINLNLLGLVVHLDPVHLNISGVQGPGNLLGNLLCTVTNLLNGNLGLSPLLQPIINLLNTVLARL